MDLKIKKRKMDLPMIEYMNSLKTASLIAAATKTGAIMAGASSKEIDALQKYGEEGGLAFQIVDDMLDRDGYVKISGVSGARDKAQKLIEEAKDSLEIFGRKADNLRQVADYILNREY